MIIVRRLTKRIGLWLAVVVLLISLAPVAAGQSPAWIALKPGAIAYLDSEGDDSDPPGQRVVCKDLVARMRLKDDDDLLLAPVGTGRRGCFVRRAYGLIRVKRIVAYRAPIGNLRVPLVAVTSLADDWSGIVNGLALLPIVPKGTVLSQPRGATFFRSRAIEFDRRLAPVNGYTVERNTMVELLRQNPPDGNHNDLYVRVLSGTHRGELMWTSLGIQSAPSSMQKRARIVP